MPLSYIRRSFKFFSLSYWQSPMMPLCIWFCHILFSGRGLNTLVCVCLAAYRCDSRTSYIITWFPFFFLDFSLVLLCHHIICLFLFIILCSHTHTHTSTPLSRSTCRVIYHLCIDSQRFNLSHSLNEIAASSLILLNSILSLFSHYRCSFHLCSPILLSSFTLLSSFSS